MKISYIFDLEKITSFVFGSPSTKQVDREIIENYVTDDSGEMTLANKTVKENKSSDGVVGQETMKYDLIKSFIEILVNLDPEEESTFGENCVLNTMQAYNFLKEIKVKK